MKRSREPALSMLLILRFRASFQPITLQWKTIVCVDEEWIDARHYFFHGNEIADGCFHLNDYACEDEFVS
jgi:hypothetical protein